MNNRKSLIIQEGTLSAKFPCSNTKRNRENSLIWVCSITPSPLSSTYTLKLRYLKDNEVKVYVIEPKPLALADGHLFLPHVYSTSEQSLCLFYSKAREWNSSMLFTDTIIPWACEWLVHYECWVSTGKWNGGGINHNTESLKQDFKLNETTNEPNRFKNK